MSGGSSAPAADIVSPGVDKDDKDKEKKELSEVMRIMPFSSDDIVECFPLLTT